MDSFFLIAIYIYHCNLTGQPVWYRKLVYDLRDQIPETQISKDLDQGFDIGLYEGEWENIDGMWTRYYIISDEVKPLIRTIHNKHYTE